jgi:hypothetical protein
VTVADWLQVAGGLMLAGIVAGTLAAGARSRRRSADDVRLELLGRERQAEAQTTADATDMPVVLHQDAWAGEEGAIMTWVAWPERYWDGHG